MNLRGSFGKVLFYLINLLTSFFLPHVTQARGDNFYQQMQDTMRVAWAQPEQAGLGVSTSSGTDVLDRRCNLGMLPPEALPIMTTPKGLSNIEDEIVTTQDVERLDSSPSWQSEPIADLNQIGRVSWDNDLEGRLENCPILRDHIVWEEADGRRVPFAEWNQAKKTRLNDLFHMMARQYADLGLSCPDPTRNVHASSGRMYLSAQEAFDVFAAHVAHAL